MQADKCTVWPVVFITTSKYILLGIPRIELKKMNTCLLECPEITGALELLDTLAVFLKELKQRLSSAQAQVNYYLNFNMAHI